MNKTEIKAFELLKSRGYKEEDIIFNTLDSPDFICKDGKRFEVKFLYRTKIIFYFSQIEKLKDNDIILVFDRDKLKYEFLWSERNKIPLDIKIVESNKFKKILVTPELYTFIKAELKEINKNKDKNQKILISELINNWRKLSYEKQNRI